MDTWNYTRPHQKLIWDKTNIKSTGNRLHNGQKPNLTHLFTHRGRISKSLHFLHTSHAWCFQKSFKLHASTPIPRPYPWIFGTVTERDFRKKIPKHGNIYKMMQCCALDFFPENALGDGPAFWIFFSGFFSRIRVKLGWSHIKPHFSFME